MCAPYLILIHWHAHTRACIGRAVTGKGMEAYHPVGGADIYSENSPLVSSSGFMVSLSSRFHRNFSLLLCSSSV